MLNARKGVRSMERTAGSVLSSITLMEKGEGNVMKKHKDTKTGRNKRLFDAAFLCLCVSSSRHFNCSHGRRRTPILYPPARLPRVFRNRHVAPGQTDIFSRGLRGWRR